MEQKSMSIYEFKRGDIITRIEPSKALPGFNDEDFKDRAYIGVAMKFLGIANGCVYVERYEKPKDIDEEVPSIGSFFKMMMGQDGPINLPLDIWDEGWSYFIDPYSLGENSSKTTFSKILKGANKIQLEKELKKALENEDYELASEIRERLKDYK